MHCILKYKLERCSKLKCCKQCRHIRLRAPWKYGPYTNLEQHETPRTRRNTKSEWTNFVRIFIPFLHLYLYSILILNISIKCWATALVRSATCIWGFNKFETLANLTLFQHYWRKNNKLHLLFVGYTQRSIWYSKPADIPESMHRWSRKHSPEIKLWLWRTQRWNISVSN